MSKSITLTRLPDDLARFAEAQVATGRFASVEDVCATGLDALRTRQERYEAKVQALDAALEEGERSGLFDGDAFANVRAKLGLPICPTTNR